MMSLMLLGVGEEGEIVEIREGETPGVEALRTEELGLRVGKRVQMLNRGGSGSPVLLKIDESRIAVARVAAMRIIVRRAA